MKYYLWYSKNENKIYPMEASIIQDSEERQLDDSAYKVNDILVTFDTLEEQILYLNCNFKQELIPIKYKRTDWDSFKKKNI